MLNKLFNKHSHKTEPTTDELDGIDPSIYSRRWQILATLCASLLLVMIGNSSLNLALPTLAEELSLTSVQLTWIVDIYALVFASLLFTASAMADRYGRKTLDSSEQLGLGCLRCAQRRRASRCQLAGRLPPAQSPYTPILRRRQATLIMATPLPGFPQVPLP